jgi:hypothetical protein
MNLLRCVVVTQRHYHLDEVIMPYPYPFYRGALGMATLWLGLSAPLSAATLKDTLDHAWAAHVPARRNSTRKKRPPVPGCRNRRR